MIELWQFSGFLIAVSFGAWISVHSKYGEKVKEKKRQKLNEAREEIEKICRLMRTSKMKESIESELVSLTNLYEESNEPIELFEQTWKMFLYAGLSFFVSIFSRLGADLLSVWQLASVEALVFLFGAFLFVIACLNTRNLMILLGSGEDPHISMLNAVLFGMVAALHLYVIFQLLPNFLLGTLTIYQLIFFVLLWCSFIGLAILLWKGEKTGASKEILVGMTLTLAPWLWIVLLAILTYIGFLH